MKPRWSVILAKELREAIRDRRGAMAVVAYALVGPAVLWAVLGIVGRTGDREGPVSVQVANLDRAPALAAVLALSGVQVVDTADVRLLLPPDFGDGLRGRASARIVLEADLSRRVGEVSRVRAALASFSETVASQRLVARGLPPSLTHPVQVDVRDLSSVTPSAQVILGSITFVILVAPFFGGLAIAADATAGERERRALAPLLQQPVDAWEVAVGKWGTVALAGVVSIIGTVGGVALVLARHADAPISGLAGIDLSLSRGVLVVGMLLPLALTVAAAQLLLALTTRTYKEAQSYLSLLSLFPFVLTFLAQGARGEARGVSELPLPVLWENAMIGSVLAGRLPSPGSVAMATMMHAVLLAGLLVAVSVQMRRAALRDDG